MPFLLVRRVEPGNSAVPGGLLPSVLALDVALPSDSDSPRLPAHRPSPEARLPLNSPGITCYGLGRQDQAPENVSRVPARPRIRRGVSCPAPQRVEPPPPTVLSYFHSLDRERTTRVLQLCPGRGVPDARLVGGAALLTLSAADAADA